MSVYERLRRRLRSSLRNQLMALALLPLLVSVPLVVLILAGGGSLYFNRLLITKVRSDLAVAHGYFEHVRDGVGGRVAALAGSEQLARQAREHPDQVGTLLRAAAADMRLDYLLLLDARGHLWAGSVTGREAPGLARYEASEVVRRALAGQPGTEIDVLDAEVLAAIDPVLANKARIPLIATRNAAPSPRSEETRGMVVHAAAPIRSAGPLAGGVLVGGQMLNRNLDFVDGINQIVYPDGALPLGSVGTATVFLDDVRIATNVRLFEGGRAIGTRVSASVSQAVLADGRTWLDRAFVVNDWYVSAYEPIADSRGRRVGMLYVGFLEAPLQHVRNLALAMVALLVGLAAAGTALVSFRLARHVSRPVERMHATMTAIESGQAGARVGGVAGEDELAELAAHFDRLLDRLAHQAEALQRWGRDLDAKVAERTRELEVASTTLRSAQQRLAMSEKLAAIGQLAAGVAHEVNNPVAVIQGNLDLLRETLGPQAEPVTTEIRLIQDQVYRIRLIVAKLLQFSRPSEYAGFLEPTDITQVVQDSLVLVGHQMKTGNISVVQELHAHHGVLVNRNEFQQVLINLMVNALQAMRDQPHGVLTLASGDCSRDGEQGVYVAVMDTGPGIPEADRRQLFDPFFTTKTGEGTGLGLWVSLSLVQRYGGLIEVACPPEGGSVFTVWLPIDKGART